MNVVLFCHSISSDWNNGNAHFQRGILAELTRAGHHAVAFEPRGAWSADNLCAEAGASVLEGFREFYPQFDVERYVPAELDLERALEHADVVIVHEWNSPELVRRIGEHRARGGGYCLFFHDTHHRMLSAPEELARFDFDGYDGVLAFGEVLRERYAWLGWGSRAFTWHEAADVQLFRPLPELEPDVDLVWIGNFGDEERTRELDEFLLRPLFDGALSARVHGVRYPAQALAALERAGACYAGWLPNYRVPEAFARARVTVHVPRRPYADTLRGIPTIRPFEALASGIPLVSAPWHDDENLFRPGRDFLMAWNGAEMTMLLRAVLEDQSLARSIAESGRETVLARHTCAHRVDELLQIVAGVDPRSAARGLPPSPPALALEGA